MSLMGGYISVLKSFLKVRDLNQCFKCGIKYTTHREVLMNSCTCSQLWLLTHDFFHPPPPQHVSSYRDFKHPPQRRISALDIY